VDDAQKHPVDDPDVQWARISSELVSYRNQQRQVWGDLDDLTLARYLAGEATEAEAERVHRAMDEHPKVRECVAIVREVAGEMVTTDAEPVRASIAATPLLDSARRSFPKRRFLIASLAVAASLFLASSITFVAMKQRAVAVQYAKATRALEVHVSSSGAVSLQREASEVHSPTRRTDLPDTLQIKIARAPAPPAATDGLEGSSQALLPASGIVRSSPPHEASEEVLNKYGLKQEGSTIVLATESYVQKKVTEARKKVTEITGLGETKAIPDYFKAMHDLRQLTDYFKAMHDLRQLTDATMKSYAELAKNEEVRKALHTLGRTTIPELKLGPSSEFLAIVELLHWTDDLQRLRRADSAMAAATKAAATKNQSGHGGVESGHARPAPHHRDMAAAKNESAQKPEMLKLDAPKN